MTDTGHVPAGGTSRRAFLAAIVATGAGCTEGDLGSSTTGPDRPTGDGTATPTEQPPTGTTTGTVRPRETPIKVGVLMPVTGDLAAVGTPIRDGAILPAARIESKTDLAVDLRQGDTETDPSAAVSAARSLVEAGYPAISGPAASAVNLQVTREVLIPTGTVGCSPSSTAPEVTTLQDDDYVFRIAPSAALQGRVLGRLAAERSGVTTAATMHVDSDYARAVSRGFVDAFEGTGGRVRETVPFTSRESSYTTHLERALSEDPDALVVVGYPSHGIRLFRDYYADFSPDRPILVSDGLRNPDLPAEVGDPMDNVRGVSPDDTGPGYDAFAEAYRAEYDREPGVFNAHAYDATAVCLLANVRGGENDGTAVRDNVRAVANPGGDREAFGPDSLAEAVEAVAAGDAIDYRGASSPVDFDRNGDPKAVTYRAWSFGDGEIVTERTLEYGG